ncbi:sel1 repeat family protein [Bradyrhizobium sp. 179]|uniref:tetratricopeptide repeat protein n=1 Tax=Bradyrhizobium sp. 179 TaxID=2782648 RepID=UPI001FF76880|nr:tetratricopeptide repeat protein [Bradyrhizobium sp. 179]MCK1541848.1 sel1 repeat family protein [Bradyrhizobium sp. 179]
MLRLDGGLVRATVTAVALALLTPFAGLALAGRVEDADAAYARGDYATALAFYRPLAESGAYSAQFVLAGMYETGRGVPQSDVEAARWYRRSAEQGFGFAQFNLAMMYSKGKGVVRDDAESAKWMRLAGEQGHVYAQTVPGGLYASGTGVPQDYVEAYKWYNLAASRSTTDANKQNQDNATQMRDLVAARMTPEQIAEAQRLSRDWKPH